MEGLSIYSAAKLGLVGMMHTLAMEGASYDIRVNALAPIAVTRVGRIDGSDTDFLTPELVAAAAAILAHQDCPWTGRTLSAGGGRVAELFVSATQGFFSSTLTPEEVADHLDEVSDHAGYIRFAKAMDEATLNMSLAKAGGPAGAVSKLKF